MNEEIIKIDAKDKRILYELEQNCRQSLGRIAKTTGVSKQSLHYRIKRLEEGGVITGFLTAVNVAKLGYTNYEAWIQFDVIPEEEKKTLVAYLLEHKNVRVVADCGGKFDLLIGVLAENTVQFNEIFKKIMRKFPGHVKNYFFSISPEFYTYPRTHFLGKEEKRKPLSMAGEPKKMQLDETELKILSLISENARMATVELAEKAGVTANTARAKLRRLEKEGVIEGYKIMLQQSRIGYENYEILATLQNMSDEKEKQLETFCELNPYSTFLLKCIGRWDVDIGFDAKGGSHFQQILTEFRSKFGDVIKDYEIVSILNWRKFTYYSFK